MARRLVGSNQYRERRCPDLPAPDRALAVPEEPPERRRCGEVWGTRCRAWVAPPDWSHGKHPSPWAREARAQDPASPPGLLQLLAEDPYRWVRWAVARNPASPPGALQQLAGDPDGIVRAAVACNPVSPPGVLGRLARDPHEGVRIRAQEHPACPPQWRALGQL